MNLPQARKFFFQKAVVFSLLAFLSLSSLRAQIVNVTAADDNASGAGDLGSAIATVNVGTDNTIKFELSSSNPITLGSAVGGLGSISLSNPVTFSFAGGFSPLVVGNPTNTTAPGGDAVLLSTSSLVFGFGLNLSLTGGQSTGIITGTGGNASVTAGSMNLLGATLNLSGGEINNVNSGTTGNATGGNAAVTAGAVSMLDSTLDLSGGEENDALVEGSAAGGSASVTAASVSMTGSALAVSGGEVNADAVNVQGTATGGSASVTAGSINLSGSTLSLAGGEVYGPDAHFAAVFGGGAALAANAVTLSGISAASVEGGGLLFTNSDVTGNADSGNASVSLNSLALSGNSTLSVEGGGLINYNPNSGDLNGNANGGNASVTLGSAALSGNSTLSVTGGGVENSDGEINAGAHLGNATAGNALVTANSVSMTGSSLNVTGGQVDNSNGGVVEGIAIAGNASVTAVSLAMTGSTLNVTGGELNDFGGSLLTSGPTAGSASVSAGAITLSGSTLNVTGGEWLNGGGSTFSGVLTGNASLTAASLTLDGASTLSVMGGNVDGMFIQGSALVSIGSLNGSGTVTMDGGSVSDLQIVSGNFAGVIAGNEVLETSAGLILSGANSYSGGTTLEGSLLGLGNNSALGTGALVMDAATTLQSDVNGLSASNAVSLAGAETFDINSNNSTLSGVISGGGSLSVINSGTGGTLTLTGANSYTGGTNITGTLVAANSSALGGGNVRVNAGGTLAVSGPLAVTVAGNYTQASTGTLRLGVGGATVGLYDTLNIGGTATLGGTLQLVSYSGFKIRDETTFDIITANSVTGTFSSFSNGLSGQTLSLTYLSNAVALNLFPNTVAFTSLAQTGNQKSVAAVLDNISANSFSNNLITYLNGLSNSSFPGVYDQMSPSNLTPMFTMGFATAQIEAGMIGQRLSQMLGNPHFSSDMAYANGPMFAGNLPAEQEAQIAQSVQPDRWGAFANGMGNFGTVNSDGNGPGYQFSTGGTTAGLDYRFAKDLVAGLMIGYDQSGTSQSTGTVNVSGGQLGLYAGWKADALHIDALVDGGLDSYTTLRQGLGGNANGSTSGTEFTGQLNVGYDMKFEDYQVSPFVSGQLTQVNVNGFTETGSLAPLTYANQGEAYVSSDLGAQVSRSWTISGIKLSPNVSAAWEHIYQGNADALTANFGTGNNFTVAGSVTGTDDAVLGAGLNAEFAKGLNVYANYQGKVGLTNYTDQAISGGVNIGF